MSCILQRKKKRMAIEIGKPDFYVILKKRRKPVETYLREQGVDSKKKLDVLVKALEVEHLVSNKFLGEADTFLSSLPKAEVKAQPAKEVLEELEESEETEELEESEVDKADDSKKKPKKRTRRSTKKSETDTTSENE